MSNTHAIATEITGPHFAKKDFSDREAAVTDAVYQMAPAKKTRSAPKVTWCDNSRFSEDATLLEAPKRPTSNTGQHQAPKTLGKAIRSEDSKRPKLEAVASTGAGGAGPQLPDSHSSFSSNALVSPSSWLLVPCIQRCAANVPPITAPAAKAPQEIHAQAGPIPICSSDIAKTLNSGGTANTMKANYATGLTQMQG